MIKQLELRNFKGETGEVILTGKDLFVGANGSGKTRILEAIELCLDGAIGKFTTVGSIYQEYGNGETLEVSVFIDDIIIKRTIRRVTKKDGTVAYSGDALVTKNGREEAKGTNKVAACLEGMTNSTVFNYASFAAKNSSDKRKMLLELIGYDEPNENEILGCLPAFTGTHIIEDTKSIDEAIKLAEKERAYYNKKQKESSGASVTNTEFKNNLEGNVKDIVALEEELSEFVAVQAKLEKDKSHSEHIIKQMSDDCDLMAAKNTEIETVMALDYDEAINETTQQLSSCESVIKEVVDTYTAKALAKSKAITKVSEDISKLEKSLIEPTKELNSLNNQHETLMDKIIAIDSFEGICPVVGIKCSGDLSKGLEPLTIELGDVSEQISIKTLEVDEITDKVKVLSDKKEALSVKYKEINKLRTKELAENKEQEKINVAAAARKIELTNELIELNKDLAAHSQKIESLKKEKQELLTKIYDPYDAIEDIDTRLLGAESAISEHKETIKSLKEKQGAMKLQQQAITQHEVDVAKWIEWKDIYQRLNDLKAFKMQSKLEPIKLEVNKVLAAAGYDYTFDFILKDDNNKDVLSFGWMKDGVIKTALSSGEQLLTSLGILKAIQSTNVVSLLLIDEIRLLDDKNLATLFNLDLDFDNIILLSPVDVDQDKYKLQKLYVAE